MGSPRRLDLETVPGLLGAGALAGLVLSAVAVALWWWLARPEAAPALPSAAAAAIAEARLTSVPELRARGLDFPLEGYAREKLTDTFDEERTGHVHEAADIMAARNTPVRAVEAGTIARLLRSASGGITIYQLDPSQRYIYYYAHLQRYADGLREGLAVERGQVIGYVGTTGNAPENAPHLHFAIFRVVDPKQWWGGVPVNPYLVLR